MQLFGDRSNGQFAIWRRMRFSASAAKAFREKTIIGFRVEARKRRTFLQ
jgi:hypothetical protein